MDLITLPHLLNGLLMLAIPIGLAIFLTNRWKVGSRIWWIGATTFILSQIGHIPFNWLAGKLLNQTALAFWAPTYQLIFNSFFLGISAGMFEEGARYLVMRWWAKDVRSWRKGVLFGAGHGGMEAIILGLITLYSFLQLLALRNADLSSLLPANQLMAAQHQVQAYWSATWYESLLGALERLFTIPCQIAMALLVMQVFTRKNNAWLFLAIGYHALLDGTAVVAQKYLLPVGVEGLVGFFAIVSVFIIIFLYRSEPQEAILKPIPVVGLSRTEPVQETPDNLEQTRYQ